MVSQRRLFARIASRLAAIEKILRSGGGGFTAKADLAASVQAVMNDTLLHCEQFFLGRDLDYLCVSGGCGLNTVAKLPALLVGGDVERPLAVVARSLTCVLSFAFLVLAIRAFVIARKQRQAQAGSVNP